MSKKSNKKLAALPPLGLLLILLLINYYKGSTPDRPSADAPGPEPMREVAAPSAWEPRGEIIRGDTSLLELPRLSGGNHNYFITHRASGEVNYSLEYDTERRHARWVCFRFDPRTSPTAEIGRTNAWAWDPDLPARYSTETWFRGSGYSRGHLVASGDRQYSVEANEQTFYYSNMSPQLQSHNAGIWARLEQRVQKWGRKGSMHDVLYVAKGGTIADGQIEPERIKGMMVIPRYYWMALLLEREGQYHSIAFLTEHREYERSEHIRDLALSVNALEQFTGLDFFYHLPDEIEEAVEAEDPQARLARQLWWSH
ncbi:DNA/RNA non-specific endonuclease [Porphyromonas sp. COT-239 OH1446]|uniref:DNA/RNA non-specific endonuclease n=1 Tax=Porphyromonas sp. COT-239 OH1446 TaxID=1515613 RepID=UPI00068DCBED|nr:DNA/RNA non-specific endonuclease [Porphyromonas sp. COT-239 OH1446]